MPRFYDNYGNLFTDEGKQRKDGIAILEGFGYMLREVFKKIHTAGRVSQLVYTNLYLGLNPTYPPN